MKRLGDLRFDGTLAQAQRDAVAHALSSAGIEVASWTGPAPIVLELRCAGPADLTSLETALGGPGRPAGVLGAARCAESLVLVLEPRASLRLLLDVIECERTAAARPTIVPLLPLSDEALCALAAATLGVADLDERRLIERFSEPLLAGGSA